MILLANIEDKSYVRASCCAYDILDNNYLQTTEFKTIKKLLQEDSLQYMTEYLRNLLKVSKKNNPNCFKKNIITNSGNTSSKRGIIYVRLSQEDLDKEKGNVSKSILNQLLMLLSYCNDKKIDIVGIFYEEDISGSDDSREEWNKTLLFCELGNTDIYICKTQARFARSIEFVEKYLHKKFIEWNIRFLSIVDNIDTYNRSNKKSSQITAMVDEWKIEEQSINTKKTLRAKNDAGQWTGSFAPYGYIEDPNDMYHLIIDENAAKVVREIYNLYANGYGYYKICKYLNEKGIPTPSKYKKLQGSKFVSGTAPNGSESWNTDTIRKILLDETYDGILIQHRTETIAYNIKGFKKIPRNEQSIIACAHDKIINPDISKIVRKKFTDRKKKIDLDNAKSNCEELINVIKSNLRNSIDNKNKIDKINVLIEELNNSLMSNNINLIIEKYNNLKEYILSVNSNLYSLITDKIDVLTSPTSRSKPNKNGEIHIFSKKVYCAICGKAFQKSNCNCGSKVNPIIKSYLHCRNHKKTGGINCDNTDFIRYEVLEKIVLEEINKMIEKYLNIEKLEKNYLSKNTCVDYQKEIQILKLENECIEKESKKLKNKFSALYNDKIDGIITTSEFTLLKEEYQKEMQNFNLRSKKIKNEINKLKNLDYQSEKKDILQKYMHIKKLNRFIIDELISKILIGKKDQNNNRVLKIFWNFTL